MATNQGGIVNTTSNVEVMELSKESLAERQKHERLLVDLEAKKRAFKMIVPTLPQDVRKALRGLRQPVRLFGENLANIRDRLRMELARREVLKEGGISASAVDETAQDDEVQEEEEEVTKYTRASSELVQAREKIVAFSFSRARARLERERMLRSGSKRKRARLLQSVDSETKLPSDPGEREVDRLDDDCTKLYKSLRNLGLEGSQYGDTRALSAICTTEVSEMPLVVTASWNANIKVWDGSSPLISMVGRSKLVHEDRITGISSHVHNQGQSFIATASIDLTGKLFKISKSEDAMVENDDDGNEALFTVTKEATLKGHAARLCKTAFHPMGEHVVTTSFDHSWRLWDIATGSQLLLQDGHAKEVYGVGFHPDGSLVATTDFASVVQNWDLRSGKSVCHFIGHAKRVLCAEYSPNGFQLATAGDDGTIKIWDMRKRKLLSSIPAHSNLISQLRFGKDEYLASSSFDGTAKLWSTRDWKSLSTLRGHEGKVMGMGVLPNHAIVTSGYDKTLKMWQA